MAVVICPVQFQTCLVEIELEFRNKVCLVPNNSQLATDVTVTHFDALIFVSGSCQAHVEISSTHSVMPSWRGIIYARRTSKSVCLLSTVRCGLGRFQRPYMLCSHSETRSWCLPVLASPTIEEAMQGPLPLLYIPDL